MRVQAGAVKINRHGGAIFVHSGALASLHGADFAEAPIQAPLAPIAVRDFAYRWCIERSPATSHRSLVDGLLARGFDPSQLNRYGALPRSIRERDQLANGLLRAMAEQFPNHFSLQGIPGFWEDEHGAHLWYPTVARCERLLIPVCDVHGRIQACQMRNGRTRGARYCWLSSARLPNGTGSGSPLHFNCLPETLPRGTPLWLIEGFLKADAFADMRPEAAFIATGGVGNNHAAILRHAQGRPVVVAFDRDYQTNASVCWQLASLLAARYVHEESLESTRLATWRGNAKGIDDAVRFNLPIEQLTFQEWWKQLTAANQQIVSEAWQARGVRLPA